MIAYLTHMGSLYDLSMLYRTRDVGVVPSKGDSDPCKISAWSGECSSRLGVTSPCGQRQQQLPVITSSLQCSQPITWPFLHRPICIQDQSSVANLLQLKTKSWPGAISVDAFTTSWRMNHPICSHLFVWLTDLS